MNRRNFITRAGMLGAAAVLPLTSDAMIGKTKYKMGLQLFSIHEDMTKNTIATLKAVKAMGYEDLETYGFDEEKVTYYGMKLRNSRKYWMTYNSRPPVDILGFPLTSINRSMI